MKLARYFFDEYLEKKESLQYAVHQNIIVILGDIFRILILGFLLPGGLWLLFSELFIPAIIWMIFGFGKLLYTLYTWYYDVWLITDRGVIDIKSKSIFDIATTRIEYHMIEGISYTISGFWHTVLNYGDLMLEKVGSGTPVTLKNAMNPPGAEAMILKCQEKYMDGRVTRDHKTLRELLAGMVREHVKEHGISDEEESA